VTNDNANAYLYDGGGRQCAVKNLTTGAMYGYLYDAEGQRLAVGTIATFNCNLASFSLTDLYVTDLNGQELTVMTDSHAWDHTNVFAGGQLLATYKSTDTYFVMNDWLGNRRGDATPDGGLITYITLPYGNGLDSVNISGSLPYTTGLHFTGKERDGESNNDYFGARYYESSTGRFLSPDPLMSTPARPLDPQQWNMYAYVRNNPLSLTDPTGEDPQINCTQASPDSRSSLMTATSPMLHDASAIHFQGNSSDCKTMNQAQQQKLDIDKMVQYANAHAKSKSTERCAYACRMAFQAGGMNTAGHPVDAGTTVRS